MIELPIVARVQGVGDFCAVCGEDLEPASLVIWDRDGGTHESCLDDLTNQSPDAPS